LISIVSTPVRQAILRRAHADFDAINVHTSPTALWTTGHLDHLLPKPLKVRRSSTLPWRELPEFWTKLAVAGVIVPRNHAGV
jgi:hypothetical protein